MGILRSLNWLDVLVIILLIRTCYIGASTGLTNELQKSLGLVIGFVLSYRYYRGLGRYISEHSFLGITWAQLLSLIGVLIGLQLAVKLLMILLSKIVKLQFKPQVEQICGGILGCLRGIFLASVVLVVLSMLPSGYLEDSIYSRSLSGAYIVKIAVNIYEFLTKIIIVG